MKKKLNLSGPNSPVAVLVSVYANRCPLNLTSNSDRGGSKL